METCHLRSFTKHSWTVTSWQTVSRPQAVLRWTRGYAPGSSQLGRNQKLETAQSLTCGGCQTPSSPWTKSGAMECTTMKTTVTGRLLWYLFSIEDIPLTHTHTHTYIYIHIALHAHTHTYIYYVEKTYISISHLVKSVWWRGARLHTSRTCGWSLTPPSAASWLRMVMIGEESHPCLPWGWGTNQQEVKTR